MMREVSHVCICNIVNIQICIEHVEWCKYKPKISSLLKMNLINKVMFIIADGILPSN